MKCNGQILSIYNVSGRLVAQFALSDPGNVVDLSIDNIRIFEFITPEGTVYVAWDLDGSEDPRLADLSGVLGDREVTITQIVTELNEDDSPIIPEVQVVETTSIPLNITPVFIE